MVPWGSGKEHQLLVCPRCLPRGGAPHCPSAPRPTHCTRAPHAAAMCIDTRDAPTLACTCTSLRAMYIRMHTPTHADMRMFMTGFMHPYIRMHTHRCTLRGATCSISQESGYPMPSRLPSSTQSPFTPVPDTSTHAYTGMYYKHDAGSHARLPVRCACTWRRSSTCITIASRSYWTFRSGRTSSLRLHTMKEGT